MSGPEPKTFGCNYDRYKRSTKEEDLFARRIGGRRLPRSGGLAWSSSDPTTAGGDVKSSELLIEHKRVEPDTGTLKLKRGWLKKVTEAAKRGNLIPALGVTFESPHGHEREWVLLPLSFVERIIGKLRED
jgi:hypothetical protein